MRPRAPQVPLEGGKLTIEIIEARASMQAGGGPARSARARALADLQLKSKLGSMRPSDEVEGLKFQVTWEPSQGAFGVNIPREEMILSPQVLRVVSNLYYICVTE